MSREILWRFKRGQGVHDQQLDILGRIVPDPDGDGAWCYGQFFENGTYEVGMAVRHATSADVADGTATAAAAKGTRFLEDTGEFDADDFVGAIGYIHQGTGAGQSFYVTKMINANKIQIHLLSDVSSIPANGVGWATALTTSSKYRIRFPGRFYIADAIGDLNAGITKAKIVVTAGYKPFGYVKCKGDIFGRFDASGTAPAAGGLVSVTTGGLLIGSTSSRAIGRAYFVETLAADGLAPINVNFPDWGPSHKRPLTQNSRNLVDY